MNLYVRCPPRASQCPSPQRKSPNPNSYMHGLWAGLRVWVLGLDQEQKPKKAGRGSEEKNVHVSDCFVSSGIRTSGFRLEALWLWSSVWRFGF